ncbi:MAG: class I SAM-dependent methyltransferase [Lewinellaceae bacterium]|nr:class I SAM-dependent methyltransferase [Lewinellaceae bacterium]
MQVDDRKTHWDSIYQHKDTSAVSWFQETPAPSLALLSQTGLAKNSRIIDVGGGDSRFVDHVLALGYQDITVLDIAASAIARARQRLGNQADQITWITSDILDFDPTTTYDFWHDRATFHFLTEEMHIQRYLNIVEAHVRPGGFLVLGTFSTDGPNKCSGLPVRQYNEETINARFASQFMPLSSSRIMHQTPSGAGQEFLYSCFQKRLPPAGQVIRSSVITCPQCGFQKEEIMPVDACQYFYTCANCEAMLRPKAGDCCVFCSYGSVKCPPVQQQGFCC